MGALYQNDIQCNKECFALQIRMNTSTNWDCFVNGAVLFHIRQI